MNCLNQLQKSFCICAVALLVTLSTNISLASFSSENIVNSQLSVNAEHTNATYSIKQKNLITKLSFVRIENSTEYKLIRVELRSPLVFNFENIDGGSFAPDTDAEPALPPSISCQGTLVSEERKICSSLYQTAKFPPAEGCESSKCSFVTDLNKISSTARDSVLQCQRKFPEFKDSADRLANLLKGEDSLKIGCSPDARSNFREASNLIMIGGEYQSAASTSRSNVLYHELLHAAGVETEDQVDALVACCANQRQCDDARALNDLRSVELRYPGLQPFLKYVGSSIADRKKRKQVYSELVSNFHNSFKCDAAFPPVDAQKKIGESFNAKVLSLCARTASAGVCKALNEALAVPGGSPTYVQLCERHKLSGVRKAQEPTKNMETVAVAGAGGSGAGVPQVMKVTAASTQSTRDPAVKADLQRNERFLSVAGGQASKVASSFFSNVGPISVASAAKLPNARTNSDGSVTVEPAKFDGDKYQFDLGNGRTFSASIPDFGDTASEAKVEVRDKATGRSLPPVTVSEETLKSAREGSATLSTTARAPTRSKVTDTGLSDGSGSSGSAAGGSVVADSSIGGTGASAPARQPSAAGSRSVSSGAGVTSSTLKRILARSADPATEINKHLEDLRAASMQVRYQGIWYPRDFTGIPKERFDLDLAIKAMGGR